MVNLVYKIEIQMKLIKWLTRTVPYLCAAVKIDSFASRETDLS